MSFKDDLVRRSPPHPSPLPPMGGEGVDWAFATTFPSAHWGEGLGEVGFANPSSIYQLCPSPRNTCP